MNTVASPAGDFSDGWDAVGFFSRGLRVKGQSSP